MMPTRSTTPIRRPNVESPLCPIFHDAVELIGRRWNGAILYVLMRGPRRYHELLAAVPHLSDRVLTVRLRELEASGLISRAVEPGPPIRVSYQLTPAGQDLNAVIDAIGAWGHKWLEQTRSSGDA
jgi:DNA-binding HxlR family transcriptional regulator